MAISDKVDTRMFDVDYDWLFPEHDSAERELCGVFESSAIVLCPDQALFLGLEIGNCSLYGLPSRVIPDVANLWSLFGASSRPQAKNSALRAQAFSVRIFLSYCGIDT
jgi:hypothetical protein